MRNYSLTGEIQWKKNPIYLVGVLLFVIGVLLLIDTHMFYLLGKKTSAKTIAFTFMLVGSFAFTFHKNNHSFPEQIKNSSLVHWLSWLFTLSGISLLSISWFNTNLNKTLFFSLIFTSFTVAIFFSILANYRGKVAGIKNNFVFQNALSNRSVLAWLLGIFLTYFYIQLYWNSKSLTNVVSIFDPLSFLLRNKAADQWFLYGTFYTFVILSLGIKFIIKYWHNAYQIKRTLVVIFSQLVFAYFLPYILEAMNFNSAVDASGNYLGYYSTNPVNSWPLNYEFFSSSSFEAYTQQAYQPIGLAYFVWGIILFLIVTPVVTYYVGKRWYCSWLCGCGGLAETAGDSFRQLSSKSLFSWKIERWVIHSVMVFVLLMTIAVMHTYFSGKEYQILFVSLNKTSVFALITCVLTSSFLAFFFWNKKNQHKILKVGMLIILLCIILLTIAFLSGGKNVFMISSTNLKKYYGFFIGAAFSGVIGVGFYPILGNRVWCRFACPMAGYMGLVQRFKSRFRITTNGGQCISCGNCSTYCEQGIDVRSYAQKGQNIVRASCVGCGICSAVCPRGVLKLENGPEENRINDSKLLIDILNQQNK